MSARFQTDYAYVINLIHKIDPIKYGKTRNYLDGAVTKLSPYISRGVITTRQVAKTILSKGYKPYQIEGFLKELAWRDYFQLVWVDQGDNINTDLKHKQPDYTHNRLPTAISNAETGIDVIDKAINELINTGYIHNHLRMYIAAITCNMAKSHWLHPARWMHYYLLDADWASNALSWQWVSGSFSSKKYVANQENINKYCYSNQRGTFLDIAYDKFENFAIPEVLKATSYLNLETALPQYNEIIIQPDLPCYLYNFYNVDCQWDADREANRILILEPSYFKQYPVCQHTISFLLELAKNISGIQVYVGEFSDLYEKISHMKIHFKEHPTTKHYKGIEHKRKWMFEHVQGYFPSFFAYWKKCEKQMHLLTE
jgi:deoxyribodipyrimidine photo-lyase